MQVAIAELCEGVIKTGEGRVSLAQRAGQRRGDGVGRLWHEIPNDLGAGEPPDAAAASSIESVIGPAQAC